MELSGAVNGVDTVTWDNGDDDGRQVYERAVETDAGEPLVHDRGPQVGRQVEAEVDELLG